MMDIISIILLVLAALAGLGTVLITSARRAGVKRRLFSFLAAALCVCLAGQIIEIMSVTAENAVFAVRFQCAAILVLYTVWYVCGAKQLRGQAYAVIFAVIPVVIAGALLIAPVFPNNLSPVPISVTAGLLLLYAAKRGKLARVFTPVKSLAIETMRDAVILLDNNWGYLTCNKSASELFPALNSCRVHDEVIALFGWPKELARANEPGQIIFTHMPPSCSEKQNYCANISRVTDGGRNGRNVGWSVLIRDVTDIMALVSQYETLASMDPLTNILNRRKFLSIVVRELSMAQRLGLTMALIMFDIDHFKEINDKYGHVVGDKALIHVTETIKTQLRGYDIICRYGGEEFIILTHAGESGSLENFSVRLCKTIENSCFYHNGNEICVTASFGAVEIPPGVPFDAAMLAVDAAMYKAKSSGRNTVVVEKTL